AINAIIYVGGGSDFQGGAVVDTTNSFSFNPATNTTGSIAPIPRATGETRALSFSGSMLVMGGGRVAPNPSNEVDIYDPGTNTWSSGSGVPSFMTARRNFPTDTDGSSSIYLSGGYDVDSIPLTSMERTESSQKRVEIGKLREGNTSCSPLFVIITLIEKRVQRLTAGYVRNSYHSLRPRRALCVTIALILATARARP